MTVDTRERAVAAIETGPLRAAGSRRGGALALLIPLALLAVAGTLRFYRLGEPARCYFDETYYYYQARDMLEQGVERPFAVHPPLGKWMIAGGLALFGVAEGSPLDQAVIEEPAGCGVREQDENPPARAREAAESFARRFAPALVGTLWVGVAYLAGMRLFRRRGTAALAALLLAVEGLAFTMSRIAMLDVFLGFWVTVGFWLLLIDRDQQWAEMPDARALTERDPLPVRPRWARYLAGVAFGLALATKLSALLAIAAAGLFVLASELAWRRRLTGRAWVETGRIVTSGVATLVLVPLVVYVASYGPWFANFEHTSPGQEACPVQGCPTSVAGRIERAAQGWLGEQARILRFHRDLDADHPYRASALTWPLLLRPVAYYYEDCSQAEADQGIACRVERGNVAEILGIGNPAIWWMALPAYLVLWAAVRRRDWVAGAILLFAALQYFPWYFSPRPVFLFYATPMVPFTCFALAYASVRAGAHTGLRWIPAAVAVLALIGFLFWYPVLAGLEIPRAAWELRMWLRQLQLWLPGWI
ncbi:MAG: phospholipid carrier-dependent glycosyltransferase [Egibacteraceae bacterium]